MSLNLDTRTSASSPSKNLMPGTHTALALMIAINLFNYIDRQVLAAVEPDIRQELFPDIRRESMSDDGKPISYWEPDPDAKSKMGLLPLAFLLTYMVGAIVFGRLAERMSRWFLVGIGVILWSLASGASGLNWGVGLGAAYLLLLLTRCFVGIGEGAYGPVAPTLISDLYPMQIRGRIMAWFYLAIPVGGALGYTLGGQITHGTTLGWRWAFYLVVPPGLLLGLLCLLKKDPPRGQADAVHADNHKPSFKDFVLLLGIPSFLFDTLGMAAMTFAMGGLAFWMPAYLVERNVAGIGSIDARTLFGALTAFSGLLATILGGLAGDWLRSRFSGSYFLVSGIMMLLGFPMVLLVVWMPFPLAWVFIFLAVFCLFFNTGPTNTILANVTHPAIRASAFAVNIFIIHLFGDAISPPLLGAIADRINAGNAATAPKIPGAQGTFETIQGSMGMNVAMTVVSVVMLLSGVLWIWGARYLERDTRNAPHQFDSV